MSDNHDLLNDNDMCSFSGHGAKDMCFNCGDHTCGDGLFDVKERHITSSKALEIRHFSASDHFERGRVDNRSTVTYQSDFMAKM